MDVSFLSINVMGCIHREKVLPGNSDLIWFLISSQMAFIGDSL